MVKRVSGYALKRAWNEGIDYPHVVGYDLPRDWNWTRFVDLTGVTHAKEK